MAQIIELPDNIIGKDDHKALESYGAHEIALGRATRYHWRKERGGDPVFELFRGGAHEEMVVQIGRDRDQDVFVARAPEGNVIVSGSLDHVMAVLDKRLTREHGENPYNF